MKTLYTIFLFTWAWWMPSSQPSTSLQSIDQYISTIPSKDAKVVYNSFQKLQSFSYSEFSSSHKELLASYLSLETAHVDRLIELCGFLQLQDELKAFAQKESLPRSLKQTLNLALVRAGDERKIENLAKNLKEIPISDDYAYNLVPKLAYTAQKPIFDHLLDQIMEDNKACKHPDMETNGSFNCAFPIIQEIAPYIEDFPVEVNRFGIVQKEGEDVLGRVRKWIGEHRTDYIIKTERY